MNIKKILITLIVLLATAWFLLYARFGVGEYAQSNDGKYEASIFVGHRGILGILGIFGNFVEFKVVDISYNRIVWVANYYYYIDTDTSVIGDRSHKNIHWNDTTVYFDNPAGNNLVFNLK